MYKECKTEDSTARQRVLEQALLAAMRQQPYEKITISHLCSQLNIPRKTFYRYFPTKEDALLSLIDHRLTACNEAVFFDWQGNHGYEYVNLERFFSFWHSEAEFLDAIRDNGFRYLLLDRTTRIVDTMKQNSTEPVPEGGFAREQVDYFIAHGLMSTALRWHHHGFPSSPQEMAQVFAELLSSPNLSISRLFL